MLCKGVIEIMFGDELNNQLLTHFLVLIANGYGANDISEVCIRYQVEENAFPKQK